MPYASNSDLPAIRRALPEHARDIYRAAFNNAFARRCAVEEAAAHRIAWAAVKRCYVRRAPGLWQRRQRA